MLKHVHHLVHCKQPCHNLATTHKLVTTLLFVGTYMHMYVDAFHIILSFVYYTGRGTDETSSDIGSSLESRETEYLDENGNHTILQSVKRQKMSEETTEVKDTTCKLIKVDYEYVIVMIRRIVTIPTYILYVLHT